MGGNGRKVMSELLLELFSEEIPAMMQKKASIAYKEIFSKYFLSNKMDFDELNIYVSLRRLTLHVTGLPSSFPKTTRELKGPRISAPQAAIDGFCRSNNITQGDLSKTIIKDVECYIYEQEVPERNVKDILCESLHIPIGEYVWAKSMHWSSYEIKWIRPLQNILCIFDSETIPFEYGHLLANNKSHGHRFMSPSVFTVTNFLEYKKKLEENFVMLDANERESYIAKRLKEEVSKLNLILKEDIALLEEVTGLAEHPQILVGKIDKEFLSLPKEVLISSMRSHQKYFSLLDKGGNFAPYFLFVSNIASSDPSVIISGNEKVLSARLADALYFYNQDIKTTLSEKAEKLDKVIFHAKLGSLKDKTLRLSQIVSFIDPDNENLLKAALLCKSDIVSEMVDEFPTLQGIMGYYYAKEESLDDEIANIIRNHYKPQGISDNSPSASSALLALADKIDNLCGLILAGEKPSGSKDPFALRRQALGIIRIILENEININLTSLVKFAINEYRGQISLDKNYEKQILLFLEERLKHFFKEKYSHGLINSVCDLTINPDLVAIELKLVMLKNFLNSKEGDNLLSAYKRANNILKDAKIDDTQLDKSSFISEYEHKLHDSINSSRAKIESALDSKNYSVALQLLSDMLKPIEDFFDNVMVKDQNSVIANNRMILLCKARNVFDMIVKFEKL